LFKNILKYFLNILNVIFNICILKPPNIKKNINLIFFQIKNIFKNYLKIKIKIKIILNTL